MDFTRSGANLGEAAIQYAKGLSCWFRDYLTAIKHGRIHPFTPLERKVREATRNEPWGPTGTLLNEITEASIDRNNCSVIFAVLEFRLKYPSEKWRNVYKALQVLEFILKRGSEAHIADAKSEFLEQLGGLKEFNFIGPDGRDYGVNVRVRSEAIKKLLEDENLLKLERSKLQKIHNKFRGYSRAEMEGNTILEETTTRSNSWGGTTPMRSDGSGRENGVYAAPQVMRKSAGEMKGVSLEDNKKHLQALRRILARPENRTCADCGDHMPTWASINCGVFLCLRCSGIHRSLGVHISKVRSCTLDTWLPEQVEFMDQTGNKIANEYWEAKLERHLRPAGTSPLFSSFAQQKYGQKQFASGVWPPSKEPVEKSPSNGVISPTPVITVEPLKQETKLRTSQEKQDLLTFEDEAFGSFIEPTKEVEVAVEEAEIQSNPSSPLQFENSALFEQRSSFLRLKSQINGDTNGSPSSNRHINKTKSSSQEVIHTTLLDFDDLESISETMSLASSKNLNPAINSTERSSQAVVVKPSSTPVQSSAAPLPLRPPKVPPTVEAKKEVTIQPVMDLLDAPLTLSPMTGDQGIDGLEDPFSFMPMTEPAAIMQSMKGVQSAPIENKRIEEMAPQTQPVVPVIHEWSSETQQAGNEANKDASLNIQELSGLDALFVQQMDDFMHFGYLSNVTRQSYI